MPQRFGALENQDGDGQCQLLTHAVRMDDMNLLKFLVRLGAEQQSRISEEEDDQKCFTISREVFMETIKLGRTSMLAEIIKVSYSILRIRSSLDSPILTITSRRLA
jgi:hypothetical protein